MISSSARVGSMEIELEIRIPRRRRLVEILQQVEPDFKVARGLKISHAYLLPLIYTGITMANELADDLANRMSGKRRARSSFAIWAFLSSLSSNT